jgi:hypothetical protein
MQGAMQCLLHLRRQTLHPAPHVGVAAAIHSRTPVGGTITDLMIAHARSPGVVTGMQTRMSAPSATSMDAASAAGPPQGR